MCSIVIARPAGRPAEPNQASAQSQPASTQPEQTPDANAPTFPYTAEITGNNVNVRSGPGIDYYSCIRLNRGDTVKVVSTQFSWSRIIPPKGCFSWISKQFVTVDPNQPNIGTINTDDVQIYAGSEEIRALHSETRQAKRGKGDKVKLFGDQEDDFYKIAPPEDAYLWVKTEYLKPIAPLPQPVVVQPAPAETNKPAPVKTAPAPVVEPNKPAAPVKAKPTPAPKPQISPYEEEKIKEYKALEQQVKDERAKPTDQQDYSAIKESLQTIADDAKAGRAARYAKFTLEYVKRYELALDASKSVQMQDEELKKVKDQIGQAKENKIKELPKKYTVMGMLNASSVFSKETKYKYYIVVDKADKIICYARCAVAYAPEADKFLGKKVGLIGKLVPHPETSGALVEFTQVEALE